MEQQRNQWWLVVGAGLAIFLATLDMTIVNVALPTIENELGITSAVTQWAVLGYLLPIVALSLPSGRWLDRVGRRPALTFAAAGFAAASVAAGAAPSIGWLVGARVVQGAFAAVLFALIPVLATIAVRPEARGRALGLATVLGPLGAVTGPALGGLLVETLGWPWIFYVNVPVVLVVIGIGRSQLPATAPLRLPDRSWLTEALVLGGAGVAVMLGLSLAAEENPAWYLLILAAVPLLVAWRRMPVSATVRTLLRLPGMAGPHVILLSVATATAFVQFLAPFFLQRTLGTSVGVAGLTLLAFPAGIAVFGPLAGWFSDRWGARRIALVGAGVITGGLALLVPLDAAWTPTDVAWRLAVVGIGMGLLNPPNLSMAMARAPSRLLGTTGASTSTARQLGFALGPALATTVWAASNYAIGGMRVAIGMATGVSALAILTLARTRVTGTPRDPEHDAPAQLGTAAGQGEENRAR